MQGRDIDIERYCDSLKKHALKQGFTIDEYGLCEGLPLLGLSRAASKKSAPCIYLCAGIHGDEPAGPLALLELLKENAFCRDIHWVLCPAMNPIGLKHGSRYAHCGQDLNRDYRDAIAYETQQHIAWLKKRCSFFDLHISLHEDWEAKGFYLYELKPEDYPDLARKMLEAARPYCSIDLSEEIDRFPANNGVIYANKIVTDIYTVPYWPQGFFLIHAKLSNAHYTLETPSSLDLEKRVLAHKSAVLSAIHTYCNPSSH